VGAWQQLFQILDQQRVEPGPHWCPAAHVERRRLEIGLETVLRLETARHLLVQRRDIGPQQAMKVERLALGLGEGRALGERAGAAKISSRKNLAELPSGKNRIGLGV
jgi:hypothetical protein